MGTRIMEPARSIYANPQRDDTAADRQSILRHRWGMTGGLRNGLDNDILREIREEHRLKQAKGF